MDQGALFPIGRRVHGRGEYHGLTFHEIEAKTIISKAPPSTPWFSHSINAYRGCSHGCKFCFARPTHEYLGFNQGSDFDSQIVVKVNAVERIRAETEPSVWGGHSIAMGTNTDPYQAAEGKYKLTRGIIEVLLERSNPFSLLTKSTLVLRDLSLLSEAAAQGLTRVDFSIATIDEDVWRRTEPGTPHPRRRLEAVAKMRGAGVPSGVMMMPLLPGISDQPEKVAELRKAAEDAGAEWVHQGFLHLRGVRQHFLDWLAQDSPELVAEYEARYPERKPAPKRPKKGDDQLKLIPA